MKNESSNESSIKLEDQIIDYYLLLKQKIQTKNLYLSKNVLKKSSEYQEEKESLKKSNKIVQIFNGLTELFDMVTAIKAENEFKKQCEEKQALNEKTEPNQLEIQQESYECLIRKLEHDLRNHMKTEFEMKLHIENLESKFEYCNQLKKENKYLHEKLKKMEDTKKENEIIILKAENKNLKDILSKKEQEFDKKEKKFSEEIGELTKKILSYEEALKFQNSKILVESDNDKSTYRSTYTLHKRSHSYITHNNEKTNSPKAIVLNNKNNYKTNNINNNNPNQIANNSNNNPSNNKLRILSSSNSNFNQNQISNLKFIEFKKVDNLKSKLNGASDADNMLNAINKGKLSRNFDSNKIISKNITKRMLNNNNNNNNNNYENENKTHYLNESLQHKNDILHRSSSNNSFNLNEPLYNSLKRPKIVAKISKGMLFSKNKN